MSLVTPRKGYKSITLLFKKTVLIPKEWVVCKGEELFEICSGYSPTDLNFYEKGEMLFVKVDDMNSRENLKNVMLYRNLASITQTRKTETIEVHTQPSEPLTNFLTSAPPVPEHCGFVVPVDQS